MDDLGRLSAEDLAELDAVYILPDVLTYEHEFGRDVIRVLEPQPGRVGPRAPEEPIRVRCFRRRCSEFGVGPGLPTWRIWGWEEVG